MITTLSIRLRFLLLVILNTLFLALTIFEKRKEKQRSQVGDTMSRLEKKKLMEPGGK
jgi:hypothetical protein